MKVRKCPVIYNQPAVNLPFHIAITAQKIYFNIILLVVKLVISVIASISKIGVVKSSPEWFRRKDF